MTWTLYVADQVGNRVAQIDPYSTCQLIARHNAVSSWSLELPTDSAAADALLDTEHPRIVFRSDDVTFRSGPVTTVQRLLNSDGDWLSLTGVDDTVWLARRVAHPQPGTAAPPYSTTAYDVRTGNAAQILAQYADVNAGPSAVAARRVPGLVVPVPAPAGSTVTLQARYENLLDFIAGKATSFGLGVRVVDLRLDVFTPVLRPVVFSIDLATLAETEAFEEAPDANFVYVAGGGTGSARLIVEVTDAGSVASWGRVETFQDRRDTSDPAILGLAGNETLARSVKPPSVRFQPITTPVQRFPQDWSVGDKVTVQVGTRTFVDVVREVVIDLEEGEPVNVVAQLGASGRLALFRATLEANRRIRQLERV